MAYNKKQHYQDNINAISTAFYLDGLNKKIETGELQELTDNPTYEAWTKETREKLSKYSGFGGLKCVLNDSLNPADWAEYERNLIPLQKELFDLLQKNSSSEEEFNTYLKSIRNSVLSAFYTPPQVVEAIAEVIDESGIKVESMLEPSAGSGVFVDEFNARLPIKEGVAVEKDLLTGKILKHLEEGTRGTLTQTVLVQGFENLPSKYENHFDLVVSNIPFGDIQVFDPNLLNSPQRKASPARKAAMKTIHNYFFVKGLDACKEGGLVAFITSQGLANSPQNKIIRQYLMDNADLVSAIRLPHNLFAEHAGTEVGTDLIVLKKHSEKTELSLYEKLFVQTTKVGNSINENAYFANRLNKVVHTNINFDKDMYGKPAVIYSWRDDFSKLKDELKSKLSADFSKNLGVSSSLQQQTVTTETERPKCNTFDELYIADWKRDGEKIEKDGIYNYMSAEYKGIQINSIAIFPDSEFEPLQHIHEVGIYGAEHSRFPEYNALIKETSDAVSLNGQYHSCVRFKNNTPLKKVVQFIDDFHSKKLSSLLDKNELKVLLEQQDKHQEAINALNIEAKTFIYKDDEFFRIANSDKSDAYRTIEEARFAELEIHKTIAFKEQLDRLTAPKNRTTHQSTKLQSKVSQEEFKEAIRTDIVQIEREAIEEKEQTPQATIPTTSKSGQLNLFDLFDLPQPEVSVESKTQSVAIPKQEQETEQPVKPLYQTYSFTGNIFSHHRPGSLAVMDIEGHGRILGTLSSIDWNDNSAVFNIIDDKKTLKHKAFLEHYIELRDTYETLYQYEADTKQENVSLRKKLNDTYDDFVKKFGTIQKNKDIIKIDSTYLAVLSLEKTENDEIKKTDIFIEPTAFDNKPPEAVDSSQDALIRSLNEFGFPNPEFMQQIFPQQEIGVTIDQLVESNLLYYDVANDNYVTKDKFLSGNMYYKEDEFLKYYQEMEDGILKNYVRKGLEDIKNITPEPIAFENIGILIGERWLPTDLYERFAEQLFNCKSAFVKYHKTIDQFVVKVDGNDDNYKVATESRRSDLSAQDLLKHALESTRPEITKTVRKNGKNVAVPDYEKQQLATVKIDQIKDEFEQFLMRLPQEEKKQLELEYNKRFNGNVRPVYDGSHQTFPGLRLDNHPHVKELYGSQKDAIWMNKQNCGGIIDHEVGGGKTLTMCITAQEMKRLGLSKLPVILGLKANIKAIADEYRTIYPNAKICFPSEKDYEPKNRMKFFNQIKNNNWDVVIMSHENFKAIPQDPEIELEILKERLEKLVAGAHALKEQSGGGTFSSRERKGLEQRIANTKAKILRRQFEMNENKDNSLTCNFNTMGFDFMLIDESHHFKNLAFETRHSRVAGIGNPLGSQRSENLLTAIRTIQKKRGTDLGAVLLSGTTIANSMSELYVLFNYLRPKAMERQGISSFDSWVGTYAKKTSDFEISVTNEIKTKERFRHFVKVPELATFYNEITDYKSAEDIGIDRPQKNETLVMLKPSEELKAFNEKLIEFAHTGKGELIGKINYDSHQDKARMLIATNAAKKASLDMRLIDPDIYGDNPLNKATKVAEKIAEHYYKFDSQKGTQFVFSDLSTWQNDKDWNIYSEIKRKLVEDHGIPEDEIAFIQTAKTDAKKEKMKAAINEGKIRVVFGSTQTLGTGVNVQKRAVAIHHLDIPWRPCDLEQRNGRAIRAMNWLAKEFNGNKVDIFIYAIEQTLDAYKFNLLQNKQTFIDQLKSGKTGSRTIDEGAMDEESGINFQEYVALLSGNTDLLEKAKLERKISTLESERTIFYQDDMRIKNELGKEKENATKNTDTIVALEKDLEKLKVGLSYSKTDEKGNVIPTIVFADGQITDDAKLIFERMQKYKSETDTKGENIKIGEFCGFDILVQTETTHGTDSAGVFATVKENFFSVKSVHVPDYAPKKPFTYKHNHGRIASSDPKLCANFALNALNKIPDEVKHHQQKLDVAKERVDTLSKIIGGIWKKEDELKNLKDERNLLELKIQKDIEAKKSERISDDVSENESDNKYKTKNNMKKVTNRVSDKLDSSDIQKIYDGKHIWLTFETEGEVTTAGLTISGEVSEQRADQIANKVCELCGITEDVFKDEYVDDRGFFNYEIEDVWNDQQTIEMVGIFLADKDKLISKTKDVLSTIKNQDTMETRTKTADMVILDYFKSKTELDSVIEALKPSDSNVETVICNTLKDYKQDWDMSSGIEEKKEREKERDTILDHCVEDISSFIGRNIITEEPQPSEKVWKWNDLVITRSELKSTALHWAENYWYDKSNFQRPESQMQGFYNDYGETDQDEMLHEGLFFEYFHWCEHYKSDPEIQKRHQEEPELQLCEPPVVYKTLNFEQKNLLAQGKEIEVKNVVRDGIRRTVTAKIVKGKLATGYSYKTLKKSPTERSSVRKTKQIQSKKKSIKL